MEHNSASSGCQAHSAGGFRLEQSWGRNGTGNPSSDNSEGNSSVSGEKQTSIGFGFTFSKVDNGAGSCAQADSAIALLFHDGRGVKESGHFVDGASLSSDGFVSANSNGD